MTIVVGVRVPKKGAVLIADGQVCDLDGRVWTNTATKLLSVAGATVAVAGNLMVLDELKLAKVQTADAIKNHLRTNGYGCEYHVICYDHVRDEMWSLNHEGFRTEHPYWAAEGIGAPYAAGALMISSPPPSLEVALGLAKQVVEVTCNLNKRCGGKVHWYVSEPLIELASKRYDFLGTISTYDESTKFGRVRVGKRLFDFWLECFKDGLPRPKMKVVVDFSAHGVVVAMRPYNR